MTGPTRDVKSLVRRRAEGLPGPGTLPPAAPVPVDRPAAERPEPEPSAPAGRSELHAPSQPRRQPPKRKARAAAPPVAPTAREVDQTRPVTVYLPGDLAGEVREAARLDRVTLAEWLLDAYDRLYDRLDAVFAPGETERRRSGLPARRRARRHGLASGMQLQLALTDAELAVLDDHQTRLGVESRSEWFTTIAQLGLTGMADPS